MKITPNPFARGDDITFMGAKVGSIYYDGADQQRDFREWFKLACHSIEAYAKYQRLQKERMKRHRTKKQEQARHGERKYTF